jgi:acyl-CoA dehydrogenase
VLNGTKRFITNAPQAGLFTVFARTDADKPGADGISAFLVEAGAPGLSLGQPDRKMGQQGAHTSDVIFDDCQVPVEALLGAREGIGFKTAMKVLDRGRIHIAAVCVAVAERLIRDSLHYAAQRQQFGRPIAEFQLVQAMLADSKAEAYATPWWCRIHDGLRDRALLSRCAPVPYLRGNHPDTATGHCPQYVERNFLE